MTIWKKCEKVAPGDLRWIEARFPFAQSFEHSECANFCFLPVEVLSVNGRHIQYSPCGGSSVMACKVDDLLVKIEH